VDVHDALERPELFDVWRLRTYFGSLGRRGVKCIERAVGRPGVRLDEALSDVLEDLERSGTLERVGKHYRLRV
jgi:hypothetical protein